MGCIQKKSSTTELSSFHSPKQDIKYFRITFSNIKIKNLPFKSSQVYFYVSKKIQFQTNIITNNNNPHWRQQFTTILTIEEQSLGNENFKITVINTEKSNTYATLLLNFKEVATGPQHFDMFLASQKIKSRITFDLKMVQRTSVRISSKYVFCDLKEQHMQQAFNFQFNIKCNNVDYQSDLSPPYLNNYLFREKREKRSESDDNQQINFENTEDHDFGQPLTMKKSKSNLQLRQSGSVYSTNIKKHQTTMDLILKKDIFWEFPNQEESPNIAIDIYIDEFATSSFEFILLSNNNINKDNQTSLSLIGNSVISLNKFYSENISMLAQLTDVQVKEAKFQNDLWNHGQIIGSIKGEFIIKNDPYHSQMLGGFRTEEGIQKSSLLYVKKDKFNGKANDQIQQVINSNLLLDDLVGQLNKKNLPYADRIKINKQIQVIICKLIAKLEKQELYKNEEELFKAQQVLTDLSKNLLESADQVDETIREEYYELLIKLLNRDEFFISYLGFNHEMKLLFTQRQENSSKLNKKDYQSLDQKIKIGLHYQNFLYKTLVRVVKKIQQRVNNENEKHFISHFFVIAFFRIPNFQKLILDILQKDQRVLDINIQDNSQYQDPTFTEWDKNFYSYLIEEQRYQEHINQLDITLQSIDWKQMIFQSRYYLKWLKLMMLHFKKAKQLRYVDNLTWTKFPGYLLQVRHVLLEIKYCEELPYPDEIKDASCSILENENIFNYLIEVVFQRTKIYDSTAVFHTLDLIILWFGILKSQNKKIPPDFNYQFLLKGLYLILEGQHAMSISKVIQLLFIIFPQLPIEVQKDISDHMLDKCFFKCFIFWSRLVRCVYQHFIIYRIQHRLRNQKNEEQNEDIRDVFQEFKLIKLQKNVRTLEEKQQLINHQTYLKYTQIVEIGLKIRKLMQQHVSSQEQQIQKHIEARSMKLKLIRKKEQHKQFIHQNHHPDSPSHTCQIDFTLESMKEKSYNSLTMRESDYPFYNSVAKQEEIEIQDSQFLDIYDDRSIGEIIDLEHIFSEIQRETKQKYQKKKRLRNNSADQIDSEDQSNDKKKKYSIYHRLGNQEVPFIHKEYIKYILQAFKEWQEAQAQYKRWFQSVQGNIRRKKLSLEQEQQCIIDSDPPEIVLLVQKDKSESDY